MPHARRCKTEWVVVEIDHWSGIHNLGRRSITELCDTEAFADRDKRSVGMSRKTNQAWKFVFEVPEAA